MARVATCKCVICLDSGYLAILQADPSVIVPMLEVNGSDLTDYKLQRCSCQTPSKGETWKKETKNTNKKNGVQQRLVV